MLVRWEIFPKSSIFVCGNSKLLGYRLYSVIWLYHLTLFVSEFLHARCVCHCFLRTCWFHFLYKFGKLAGALCILTMMVVNTDENPTISLAVSESKQIRSLAVRTKTSLTPSGALFSVLLQVRDLQSSFNFFVFRSMTLRQCPGGDWNPKRFGFGVGSLENSQGSVELRAELEVSIEDASSQAGS